MTFGAAQALAAARTDTLATKQNLHELAKRVQIRFAEQSASVQDRLADLERRMTVRLLAGIAAVSALVKLL